MTDYRALAQSAAEPSIRAGCAMPMDVPVQSLDESSSFDAHLLQNSGGSAKYYALLRLQNSNMLSQPCCSPRLGVRHCGLPRGGDSNEDLSAVGGVFLPDYQTCGLQRIDYPGHGGRLHMLAVRQLPQCHRSPLDGG